MPESVHERRRYPRAAVGGRIEASLLASMPVRLLDISAGGVLLQSDCAGVPTGSEAEIRTFLGGDVFSARLRVVRAGRVSGGAGIVLGAAFVGLTGESQRVIKRFLERANGKS